MYTSPAIRYRDAIAARQAAASNPLGNATTPTVPNASGGGGSPAAPGPGYNTPTAPGPPSAIGTAAPGTPGTPGTPGAPGTPGTPGTPGAPGAPGTPGTPTSPVTPTDWRGQMQAWQNLRPQRPDGYDGGWGHSSAMNTWRDARPNHGSGHGNGHGSKLNGWRRPDHPGQGHAYGRMGMRPAQQPMGGQPSGGQPSQGGRHDISGFLASLRGRLGNRP